MSLAASGSGTWWIWMFWRVVMWPLLSGRVLLDDVGEGLELLGRDAAHRQLHADHLDVGLALAVDALLEAEADELRLRRLAAQELRRLGVEVVELALEDRDDVAGNVLEDLGVLDRAAALRHREGSGLHGGVGLLARSARAGYQPIKCRPGFSYLAG